MTEPFKDDAEALAWLVADGHKFVLTAEHPVGPPYFVCVLDGRPPCAGNGDTVREAVEWARAARDADLEVEASLAITGPGLRAWDKFGRRDEALRRILPGRGLTPREIAK